MSGWATRGWGDARAVLGRGWAAAAVLAVALGVVAFVWGALLPDAHRAWGALLGSWLFFTGMAMGTVVFGAVLSLSNARWADSLLPLTSLGLRFLPVAGAILIAFVSAVGAWAPWVRHIEPERGFYLNVPFFVVRQIGGAAILFWLAHRFARRGASGHRAVLLALAYPVVLSLWAFDFILALDPTFVSTMIGPHLFMGAFLSGIALVAILGVATGRTSDGQRHDLGKLLFGFSIFWAYLFWSQYLAIWYGNLPEETAFVLRRTSGAWRLAAVLVAVLAFGPLAVLLHERAKRAPRALATIAIVQLLGHWVERSLLVAPSLVPASDPVLTVRDVLVDLGVLGAFVLAIASGLHTLDGAPATQNALPPPARHR